MKKFLCFFVGAACLAGTFGVPHVLDYEDYGSGKTMKMQDPASVGLQACELHLRRVDTVFIQNLEGETLSCMIWRPMDVSGVWFVSAVCSGEDVGEVSFLTNDELGQCLEVASCGYEGRIQHPLGAVNLWKSRQRCRYEIGKESVFVRKFFACDEAGAYVFVSATISYNDLKRVEIGVGKGGKDWIEEGVNIGTLRAASTCSN